jgi:transcriptional antiterminator RfaH
VSLLKNREDANGVVKLDRRSSLRAADKIRALDGVFSCRFSLFEGLGEREPIAILLDLVGRRFRVVLDPDLIAAV